MYIDINVMYKDINVWLNTYEYIYMIICIYVCMYVYIYMCVFYLMDVNDSGCEWMLHL